MIDLSLITTQELIAELKQRSKALVVGLDPMADKSMFSLVRHGNKLAVAGLLTLDSDYDFLNDPRDK
jgi:hypothetical protein